MGFKTHPCDSHKPDTVNCYAPISRVIYDGIDSKYCIVLYWLVGMKERVHGNIYDLIRER